MVNKTLEEQLSLISQNADNLEDNLRTLSPNSIADKVGTLRAEHAASLVAGARVDKTLQDLAIGHRDEVNSAQEKFSNSVTMIDELNYFMAQLNNPAVRLNHLLRQMGSLWGAPHIQKEEDGLHLIFGSYNYSDDLRRFLGYFDPGMVDLKQTDFGRYELIIKNEILQRLYKFLSPDEQIRKNAQEELLTPYIERATDVSAGVRKFTNAVRSSEGDWGEHIRSLEAAPSQQETPAKY